MPELITITDPNLPEPKDISTASLNQVYIADGAGSGNWRFVNTHGWEDYNDSGSSQSLTNGSWVDLTNDGAGSFTNTTYRLPGYNAIWDTATDQFDWSGAGLTLGDTVDLRVDVLATTTSTNDTMAVRLDMAEGSGNEYSLELMRQEFDSAGTYQMVRFYSVYMGDTNTLNFPAKVSMFTNSTGNSVVVNGWFARVLPRRPVYSET